MKTQRTESKSATPAKRDWPQISESALTFNQRSTKEMLVRIKQQIFLIFAVKIMLEASIIIHPPIIVVHDKKMKSLAIVTNKGQT